MTKMAPEKLSPEKSENLYQYSFLQKLFYFIAGFPPRPRPLPDETWENWKNRFKQPEYDWTHHSGKNGGQRP
jgi:hypothetical protein